MRLQRRRITQLGLRLLYGVRAILRLLLLILAKAQTTLPLQRGQQHGLQIHSVV